jgi:S-adenosylmethionine hydrolase
VIYLFTDFGAADIYVGQVKARLAMAAPGIPVIDLLHDAPAFRVQACAHLLCALTADQAPGSVTAAVVDPGVGTSRRPIAVRMRESWFVGPDNGLLSVLAARSDQVAVHEIVWAPSARSASFHGRDLFAPIAARLAAGDIAAGALRSVAALAVAFGAGDLAEVIYIDHYGNALTGLRATEADCGRVFSVHGRALRFARVFAAAPPGTPFWYVNSIGLVEIALDRGSAAGALGLRVGDAVDDGCP